MPLHLHFEQNEALLYDFTRNHILGRRSRKVLIITVVLLSIFLLIHLISQNFSLEAFLSWELGFLLFLALFIVFLPWISKRNIARTLATSKFGLKREMLISEEEIIVKTEASDSTFAWNAILKTSESELSYFLFIASNQALLIPKDCLTAETEAELLALFNQKGLPLKK